MKNFESKGQVEGLELGLGSGVGAGDGAGLGPGVGEGEAGGVDGSGFGIRLTLPSSEEHDYQDDYDGADEDTYRHPAFENA